ncbi:hypothetical protein [Xanthomonas campestris]|uniref:hypothetical protein n=1 Tax=Xanthomonas campestris TaxID=339 RepID=UPI00388DF02B
MQTIAFMTPINLLKCSVLLALACAASTAGATGTSQGLDNSTLHIGLRVLSGCELHTSPARANCSKGTPAAIAPAASSAPETAGTAASATGQVASALAGPAPTGAARITTVAF